MGLLELLFALLATTGLMCLAGSFYWRGRKRSAHKKRSRTLFIWAVGLLISAPLVVMVLG